MATSVLNIFYMYSPYDFSAYISCVVDTALSLHLVYIINAADEEVLNLSKQ